jgi:glycosidase
MFTPANLALTALLWSCSIIVGLANGASVQVSPPSWWVNHPHNPVRLMFTGKNFAGLAITPPKGFVISNVVVTPAGDYAFCDAYFPSTVEPGRVEFQLSTPIARQSVPFMVMPPPSRPNTCAGFTTDDVIYLLMPDRFANGDRANDDPAISPGLWNRAKPRDYHGGDFQGVINQLPYLRDLGVTALWLTPWYDNVNHANKKEKYTTGNQRSTNGIASTDYHGYGAVDFYGVEEHFGDLDKLQELVARAQTAGFKFIQDQVANHTGPYHPWAKSPPAPTWFNGTPEQHLDNSWQTWTIAERHPPADQLKSTLEGWFINILPDLNQNDPETATYLIQNSLWWIGMTGVDAVRQDTLPYVPRAYWAKWTAALKQAHPRLTVLGEMFDARPELVAFFQGGRKQFDGVDSGVDTLFDFPLHYALRDVFARRQPMTRLERVLSADTNYVNPQGLVTFLGLHDTARFMNEPGANVAGLQLAFTYLLTTRGTPMIYYGDEIGMPGGGDPDNRRDFPGGWPDDARNAFTSVGRTAAEEQVHAHVRTLLALRRELEPLRRGETRRLNFTERTAAFARLTPTAAVIVAFNNGDQPAELKLSLPESLVAHSQWFDRLAKDAPHRASAAELSITLPPRRAAILCPHPAILTSERGKTQARSQF